MKKSKGKLFVVSGPSGAGKTTLVDALIYKYGKELKIARSISYTTRPRRDYEVDGIDYHFISKNDFDKKRNDFFFLEWSEWGGHCYGTPLSIVDDLHQGYSYIVIIDRKGALQIVDTYKDAVLIWITVSDIKILEERLRNRSSESEENIQKRIKISKKEMLLERAEKRCQYQVKNANVKESLDFLYELIRSKIPFENKKK